MQTFRITYDVNGLSLDFGADPVRFAYAADLGTIHVEIARQNSSPFVVCHVLCAVALGPSLLRDLEVVADRRLPKGGPDADSAFIRDNTGADGRFNAEFRLPIRFLPEALRSSLATLERRLADYAERTTAVIRWQFGMPGRYRALSNARYEFSIDGQSWSSLPYEIPRPERALLAWTFDPAARESIENYVAAGLGEPLAHEFYREAVAHRIDNPRSSLAMAVAAAEVGIKQTAASVAPDTRWLMTEGPSPSAIKLLVEYLPTLRIRRFQGHVVPPTRAMKRNLGDAVKARNELVHAGAFTLEPDRLIEMLDSIKDLLWLLDFYTGQTWALNNMTAPTQRELVKSVGARDIGELAGG